MRLTVHEHPKHVWWCFPYTILSNTQWIQIYIWWFLAYSSWGRVCKALHPHARAYISHFCLTLHVYTILHTSIRECAQKLELRGRDTIISHIEMEFLHFGMSYQIVHSLQHVWLDEGLEIWYFLNHIMRDHRNIIQIHVSLYSLIWDFFSILRQLQI